MIRVLAIGPDAPAWVERLRAEAVDAEFEAARLPAAAVRAFDKSPADLVLLCGGDHARMADVLSALRTRPLGDLVPSLGLGEHSIAGTDGHLGARAPVREVLAAIAAHLGLGAGHLGLFEVPAPEPGLLPSAPPPASAGLPDAIATKLHDVRHGSYFEVLEIPEQAHAFELRAAHDAVLAQFGPAAVGPALAEQYASALAEVRDGVADALAVLSDPRLRAAYIAGLNRADGA